MFKLSHSLANLLAAIGSIAVALPLIARYQGADELLFNLAIGMGIPAAALAFYWAGYLAPLSWERNGQLLVRKDPSLPIVGLLLIYWLGFVLVQLEAPAWAVLISALLGAGCLLAYFDRQPHLIIDKHGIRLAKLGYQLIEWSAILKVSSNVATRAAGQYSGMRRFYMGRYYDVNLEVEAARRLKEQQHVHYDTYILDPKLKHAPLTMARIFISTAMCSVDHREMARVIKHYGAKLEDDFLSPGRMWQVAATQNKTTRKRA